jgi:microcystin-dependent protein
LSTANLDAEHNDFVEQIDQLNTFVRGITTASGTLKNLATSTSQALAGAQRFVATAGQTVFTTTIAYQASFNSTNVEVFDRGIKIDSALVTVANAGGFLQVTIPVQSAGHVIFVAAFESGAGLTTRLANTGSSADGANMIGVQDTGALIAATTVEGALAEIVTNLNSYIASIGAVAELFKRNGSVAATGNFAMGSNRITGLADGIATTDAATVAQVNSASATLASLANSFIKRDGTNSPSADTPWNNKKITGLATPTAGTDATNKTYVDTVSANAAPVGVIFPFAGTSIPSGWLLCNGAAVSRTTYAALFAVIGTTYGSGDGTTTFNLPNPQGRTLVGAGNGAGGGTSGAGLVTGGSALSPRATGQWFGEETHTLTLAETPAHTHTLPSGCGGGGGVTSVECVFDGVPGTWTTNSQGGGTAHNVMQPCLVVSFIIKT